MTPLPPAPPSDTPLLYSYRRCPYAMRARMALLQAGRRVDVFDVVLRAKPAALLALSPKGTVPVLHLCDGQVLEESLHIMAWAWSAGDPQGWWARAQAPADRALVSLNDGPFKRHLDRCKYPERHPDESLEVQRAAAVAVLLEPLQQRLAQAPFLGGSTPSATDLAIFPFVRQFAAVDPDRFAAEVGPAVQHWLAGWLATPLFALCMRKLPSERAVPLGPAPDPGT